jgi:uncharacterized damage-inducible protein DinB
MSDTPAWFDRKFEFTFPVEQFSNLQARLRDAPSRLEEIVRDVPRDVLTRTPAARSAQTSGARSAKTSGARSAKTSVERKWSAQEQAGHLLDLEPLWAARVGDFLRGGDTLTAADLTNRKTHEADHNARDIREILAAFRDARSALLERVASLPPDALSKTMIHPRLKQPMRLVDHLYFVAEHDDHHLAAIRELIES